jgi:beta-galactosidase
MENYSDRKHGSFIGLYNSTVKAQLTPYEKPMECGNHEDVRWASVTNSKGDEILVKNDSSFLQISALPYSDEEMENVEYRIDLPKSNKTVLCVNHLTLGVGSNGCGPRPLPAYLVYAKPTTFSYELQLLTKKNN